MPKLAVNGTELFYHAQGPVDAPAVVFAHSLFFDHSMFHHQLAALATQYRVVAFDFRGQGQSAPAPRDALDMDTLSQDAAALIRALGLAPCHFVGNSMGGFVALRLAARHPELLRSAAALASSGEAEHRIAEFAPLVERLAAQGTGSLIDTLMYIMFGDHFLVDADRAAERAHWRQKMLALPRSIADAAYAVVFRKPINPELSSCRVPVLALAGAEDHAYGPAEAQAIAAASGGYSEVIEDAGHSLSLERPQAVNAALLRHFRRTERPQATIQ